MIEWNLPPLRFRGAGSPGLFVSWARTSLFAGGLFTEIDDDDLGRELQNAGIQIDLRMTALSRLEMTLSVGYAVAFEGGVDEKDEFMASLKILH